MISQGVARYEIKLLFGYLTQNVYENDLTFVGRFYILKIHNQKNKSSKLFWRVLVIALV